MSEPISGAECLLFQPTCDKHDRSCRHCGLALVDHVGRSGGRTLKMKPGDPEVRCTCGQDIPCEHDFSIEERSQVAINPHGEYVVGFGTDIVTRTSRTGRKACSRCGYIKGIPIITTTTGEMASG